MLVLFRVKWCRTPLALISKEVVEVTEIHIQGRTGLFTYVNHKYPSWIKTYFSDFTFYCKNPQGKEASRVSKFLYSETVFGGCNGTKQRYPIFLNKSLVLYLRNRKLVSNPRKNKDNKLTMGVIPEADYVQAIFKREKKKNKKKILKKVFSGRKVIWPIIFFLSLYTFERCNNLWLKEVVFF